MINPMEYQEYRNGYNSIINHFIKNKEIVSMLSYPFIPILENQKKIILVGLETRGWCGEIKKFTAGDISSEMMAEISQSAYEKIDKSKVTRSKFGQLKRKIKKRAGEYPIWLNFFAFDYKKKSILLSKKLKKNNVIDKIIQYSIDKLAFEIKLAEPDLVIFCGSYSGLFNCLKNKLTEKTEIINSGKYTIEKWDNYIVARIPHPASRIKGRDAIIDNSISLSIKYLGIR